MWQRMEGRGRFPAHWGDPPSYGTKDLRVLPGGYGRGSSTLASWIRKNMDKEPTKSRKPMKGRGKKKKKVDLKSFLNFLI